MLLWDFFQDSATEAGQWRVVLNGLPLGTKNIGRVPAFNDAHHAGICSEVDVFLILHRDTITNEACQLKSLYVAITRSRKNLWIFDTSKRAEPMEV